MPHTLPDYTSKWKTSTIVDIIDPGEAAARLNSINTFDRRGNVIWMDDFEGTILKWMDNGIGAGGTAAITNSAARSGSASCKITTGAVAGNEWYILRRVAYPVLTKIGCETAVTMTSLTGDFRMWIWIRSVTDLYKAEVRYKKSAHTWYVKESTGAWTTLSTSAYIAEEKFHFSNVKLVVDYATKRYVRLIVDNNTFDLSASSLSVVGLGGVPFVTVILRCQAEGAAAVTAYVDDVILTQNEV